MHSDASCSTLTISMDLNPSIAARMGFVIAIASGVASNNEGHRGASISSAGDAMATGGLTGLCSFLPPRCAPEAEPKMAPGEHAARPLPCLCRFAKMCAFPRPFADIIAAAEGSRVEGEAASGPHNRK